MFCTVCGSEIKENDEFCSKCGTPIKENQKAAENIKVILDPSEVVEAKEVVDSSKTFSRTGKIFGIALMICSVFGDLLAMFAIGFDLFIPITIVSTVLFIIGFFMMMFCRN